MRTTDYEVEYYWGAENDPTTAEKMPDKLHAMAKLEAKGGFVFFRRLTPIMILASKPGTRSVQWEAV